MVAAKIAVFIKEVSQRDSAAAFFSISQHCQQQVYSKGHLTSHAKQGCNGETFQVFLEIAFPVLN